MSRIVDVEPLDCLAWKDGEHGTTFDDGVLWVLEKISELPTIEPQRWIPCSERLPENETKYYLVTVANHGLFFTTTSTDSVEIVRWDYDRRKGRDSWHWCTERTVIAWMPLPEVYGG